MRKPSSKFLIRFFLGLFIVGILAFLFLNENGILKFLSLKSQLKELDKQIKIAESKILLLQGEIDSLKNSKEKIEKVAREKFHMMFPNERVIRVEEN